MKVKICLDCGHRICPHCEDWCDTVLMSPKDNGFIPAHVLAELEDLEDMYPETCCDMECKRIVEMEETEADKYYENLYLYKK